MSTYRRYFRFTKGPVVDEIDRLQNLRAEAAVEAVKLAEQVGGAFQTWESSGAFAGFTFDQPPCIKTYRHVKKTGLWLPRKNTPEGKIVWDAVTKVDLPDPIQKALKLVDLSTTFPALFDGGRCYMTNIWGYGQPTSIWFVSVPWKDVDPAEMAQYKLDRAANIRGDSNLDHLSWTVPEGWTEVKEWQISKEAEEINTRLKETKEV